MKDKEQEAKPSKLPRRGKSKKVVTQKTWDAGMAKIADMYGGRGVKLIEVFASGIGTERYTVSAADVNKKRSELKLMLEAHEVIREINTKWRNANLEMTITRFGPTGGKPTVYALEYRDIPPSRNSTARAANNMKHSAERRKSKPVY